MKQILRKIEPYENSSFSKKVKGPFDYFRILFLIVRKILDNSSVTMLSKDYRSDIPYLKLVIDKQSRVFVYLSPDKFYSLSFPFYVELSSKNEVTSIYSNGVQLTNEVISDSLAIINDVETDSIIGTFEESFIDSNYAEDSYKVLENMWQNEPSYVRYDFDPKNSNEQMHPLNHLDINYSKKGNYKLGLNQRMTPQIFEDIIDSNSECYFINGRFLHTTNNFQMLGRNTQKKKNKR